MVNISKSQGTFFMKRQVIGLVIIAATLLGSNLTAHANSYEYSPQSAAELIAIDPDARINLRAEPRIDSTMIGYGLVGDQVHILDYEFTGYDDYGWYYVQFDQSGARGWIRADFVDNYAE
jgi:hypothetical protein